MMVYKSFFLNDEEKPLDQLTCGGGFSGIFRTIGCVGDSLSSGVFEATSEDGSRDLHEYYEYSWGQYMAREIGAKVYNFSKRGLSARSYCEHFAPERGFWDKDKVCQAYILALGYNDITKIIKDGGNLGSLADVKPDWRNNEKTFVGYYAQIIQRLKEIQPKAKFFLMTIPRSEGEDRNKLEDTHQSLLYELSELFENTYVMDFRKYGPVYDEDFKKKFYLGGHMNPAGYLLTARMVESYLDYIIRHDMESFVQVGFIGTPYHNVHAKW